MKKPITFSNAAFLVLLAVYLLQQGDKLEFWMIFLPWMIDFALVLFQMAFANSEIAVRFYQLLGRMLFKLRAWQIRRQIRK